MSRRRIGSDRRAAIFVFFILATVAISGSARAQRDHDRDRDRDRDDRPRTMDFGGGSGGSRESQARCGPDDFAVGFHVQMGEFFNLISVDCAHVRPEGGLGHHLRATEQAGTPGGREERDAICPEGQVLVGLQGYTGGSIDQAAGICADPRDITDPRGYRTQVTNTIAIPRPGGRPAQAQCSAGQVMKGVRARSGEYIDHLWILCSDVDRRR